MSTAPMSLDDLGSDVGAVIADRAVRSPFGQLVVP
jgi:hypothetical protein